MPGRDPVLDACDDDSTREAGSRFLDLVLRYLDRTTRGEGPVSTPLSPEELFARFDEPLPRGGRPLEEVLERLERDVLGHATRLVHPMCMGHQVSAPLPAAIWTEAVIGAVNGSMAVREMSPSGNALEHLLVRWFATLAGFEDAGVHEAAKAGGGARAGGTQASAGGTLTSGGTEATFTALLAARARALPEAWEKGVGADPPAVVYGAQAHYAVTRAIGELGLGLQAGISVPLRDHAMDIAALCATLDRLEAARRPVMAVVATAGSTATGAFDDLEAIGAECERRGLWLHVDGAHGASALLSDRHRHRLAGLARASSIAWDPHKMMLLPLSAGLLLVRNEADLEAAFAQRAPYLFHQETQGERNWDQGLRSFQCSRRTDAIKLWLVLERYGADGIGRLYDRLCDTAQALHAKVAAHPAFETLHEPQSNILCFRYIGDLAGPDAGTGAAGERDAALDRLNFDLRRDYNQAGEGWITTTLLEGKRVLRVTIMNPRTEERHLDRLLEGLARTGAELARGGDDQG